MGEMAGATGWIRSKRCAWVIAREGMDEEGGKGLDGWGWAVGVVGREVVERRGGWKGEGG